MEHPFILSQTQTLYPLLQSEFETSLFNTKEFSFLLNILYKLKIQKIQNGLYETEPLSSLVKTKIKREFERLRMDVSSCMFDFSLEKRIRIKTNKPLLSYQIKLHQKEKELFLPKSLTKFHQKRQIKKRLNVVIDNSCKNEITQEYEYEINENRYGIKYVDGILTFIDHFNDYTDNDDKDWLEFNKRSKNLRNYFIDKKRFFELYMTLTRSGIPLKEIRVKLSGKNFFSTKHSNEIKIDPPLELDDAYKISQEVAYIMHQILETSCTSCNFLPIQNDLRGHNFNFNFEGKERRIINTLKISVCNNYRQGKKINYIASAFIGESSIFINLPLYDSLSTHYRYIILLHEFYHILGAEHYLPSHFLSEFGCFASFLYFLLFPERFQQKWKITNQLLDHKIKEFQKTTTQTMKNVLKYKTNQRMSKEERIVLKEINKHYIDCHQTIDKIQVKPRLLNVIFKNGGTAFTLYENGIGIRSRSYLKMCEAQQRFCILDHLVDLFELENDNFISMVLYNKIWNINTEISHQKGFYFLIEKWKDFLQKYLGLNFVESKQSLISFFPLL